METGMRDDQYGSGAGCRAAFIAVVFAVLMPIRAGAVNVLTQHNDNYRTGANLAEFVLNTSNVNTAQFGKVFSRTVDGQMYAQPLYVHAVAISNQFRNIVYVCTESNSVYAFDADSATASNALWQVNLGPPVPIADLNNCDDLSPIVGITSTPVIDPTTGTIYVEAKTVENGNYFHRLHALDIATGQEKFGGPVVIQASVPGTADGGTLDSFNAQHALNRPGLLLLSNVVYVAFGSHCDWGPYYGWVLGYGATNLHQQYVFNATPNAGEGGIWSSGTGPAADAAGNIYVETGNATFDVNIGGPDFGDSFLKLAVSNDSLVVASWFTPYNQEILNDGDVDLNSGGSLLLPTTNMLVGISKQGVLYLLNRDEMGGYSTANSDTNIVQEFQAVNQTCCIGQCPVYWNGPSNQVLFTWSGDDVVKAFQFNGASIQTTPLAQGILTQDQPGGLSLSAQQNLVGSGILWGILSSGELVAYDASNVAHELWDSQQNAARDSLGTYVQFASPTIANGKVYAPTGANQLVVYGLLTAPYQLWQQANFTTEELTNAAISGDTADPDGDGIPNLAEYALGLNPKAPDATGAPVASIQNIGGSNYLTLTYRQVLYDTDISYNVQVSGDLVTWDCGAGFTAVVGSPIDNGDGTETWTIQDLVPSDSATARFIRLQISH
jgi:hypothetical protein